MTVLMDIYAFRLDLEEEIVITNKMVEIIMDLVFDVIDEYRWPSGKAWARRRENDG